MLVSYSNPIQITASSLCVCEYEDATVKLIAMGICGEIIFYERHSLELHSRTEVSRRTGDMKIHTDGGILRASQLTPLVGRSLL